MRLSIRTVLSKCRDLLAAADNKPYFFYRVKHYLKRNVSIRRAKKWAQTNKRFYASKGIEAIWFETYDGSDQLCHPDIAFWKGYYWMVATPYPYGMEEYENPSVFFGKSILDMCPIKNNPVALPSKKGYGSHLSDPCLFCEDQYLYCFYRDTINNGDSIENRICYVKTEKNISFSDEKILLSSFEDGLLSPAVLHVGAELCLFYVSYIGDELSLLKAKLSENMTVEKESVKNVLSKDIEWDIWHFDAKETDGEIEFLLLKRAVNDRKIFKLQKAFFDLEAQQIVLKEDVFLPEELQSVMAHPYKSCIIPNSNKILLSFRDNNSIYVTKVI